MAEAVARSSKAQFIEFFERSPNKLFRASDLKYLCLDGSSEAIAKNILNVLVQNGSISSVVEEAILPSEDGRLIDRLWTFYILNVTEESLNVSSLLNEYKSRVSYVRYPSHDGITCKQCLRSQWKTLETRKFVQAIRRRKECLNCGYRISTIEQVFDFS